jgi:hypothetical protein
MSEIINLVESNPDSHVYAEAVNILSRKLETDYSFIFQVWDHEMPQDTKYEKILISTSDEAHQIPSQANDPSFVHIFKQYVPMEDANDPSATISKRFMEIQTINKVTPLPLCHLEGVKDLGIPILEREYDWSWMGQYDPYRRVDFKIAVDDLCRDTNLTNKVLWYEGWNNGTSIESYSSIVNNTKVMLVPRGSGSLESFRFFEAMMCGCLVVAVAQPETDFYNVAPCVKVSSWSNLSELITNILRETELVQFLSYQAKNWYNYYCSPQGLADYMYRSVKRSNPNVV